MVRKWRAVEVMHIWRCGNCVSELHEAFSKIATP
jgi:hypothetical protein